MGHMLRGNRRLDSLLWKGRRLNGISVKKKNGSGRDPTLRGPSSSPLTSQDYKVTVTLPRTVKEV